MKLFLNEHGRIGSDYPKVFYRLEHYYTGEYVADYSTREEAVEASFVSNQDERFAYGDRADHRVSKMHLG